MYNWPGAGSAAAPHRRGDPFHDHGRAGARQRPGRDRGGRPGTASTSSRPAPATNPIATVIELSIAAQPRRRSGTGTGLKAEFWDNATFSGTPAVTRVDRGVNYAWRYGGSPAPSIPADNFSARWTGFVQPEYSEPYTFLTVSDDTVRVWIDGALVIDDATPHDARIDKGTVALQAGRRYAIRVDATERTGEAALKLLWYGPDLGQRIVPTRQLYPAP